MALTMKRPKSKVTLDLDDARMIVIAAFRYYLGRMTISVWAFGQWLEKQWDKLDEGTRQIIARELEEAFERDDEQRANGEKFHRLGHDCDRATWSRIRALYRVPTCVLCDVELPNGVEQNVHSDGERSCMKCAPPECEVCERPFHIGEQVVPNSKTRRCRHPGCKPKSVPPAE